MEKRELQRQKEQRKLEQIRLIKENQKIAEEKRTRKAQEKKEANEKKAQEKQQKKEAKEAERKAKSEQKEAEKKGRGRSSPRAKRSIDGAGSEAAPKVAKRGDGADLAPTEALGDDEVEQQHDLSENDESAMDSEVDDESPSIKSSDSEEYLPRLSTRVGRNGDEDGDSDNGKKRKDIDVKSIVPNVKRRAGTGMEAAILVAGDASELGLESTVRLGTGAMGDLTGTAPAMVTHEAGAYEGLNDVDCGDMSATAVDSNSDGWKQHFLVQMTANIAIAAERKDHVWAAALVDRISSLLQNRDRSFVAELESLITNAEGTQINFIPLLKLISNIQLYLRRKNHRYAVVVFLKTMTCQLV